jgi:spore germination cell wall hydrolase CwlJ-like protein
MSIDESIELVEAELLKKIWRMVSMGMSVASIAAALTLPVKTVDAAIKARPATVTKSNFGMDEIDAIARTLYAEARGEGVNGVRAVASVIYNRARGNPNKLMQVIRAPYQFTPWNKGQIPSRGSGAMWDECLQVAKELRAGSFTPIIYHTHYYNPKLANPSWAYNKGARRPFTQIGQHRFLTIENVVNT